MKSNDLIKKIKNEFIIYTIIAYFVAESKRNVNVDIASTQKSFFYESPIEILFEYRNFVDIFSNEYVKDLFERKIDDHVINTNETEFSFDSLYNLSTIELKTLREYFDDMLIKK